MSTWTRYRFRANAGDFRPVKFPPPGPYWCTGYGGYGDDDYSVVVAFLPPAANLFEFWPEATEIATEEHATLGFNDRFPKPDWWTDQPDANGKPR